MRITTIKINVLKQVSNMLIIGVNLKNDKQALGNNNKEQMIKLRELWKISHIFLQNIKYGF
jgi:hypothetical protein